jgi:hypothetical protein
VVTTAADGESVTIVVRRSTTTGAGAGATTTGGAAATVDLDHGRGRDEDAAAVVDNQDGLGGFDRRDRADQLARGLGLSERRDHQEKREGHEGGSRDERSETQAGRRRNASHGSRSSVRGVNHT